MAAASCPEIAGRISLSTVAIREAQSVWCFMLDSSHPDIASQVGPCNSAYTNANDGLYVRLCRVDDRGRCRASQPLFCAESLQWEDKYIAAPPATAEEQDEDVEVPSDPVGEEEDEAADLDGEQVELNGPGY